MSQYLVALPLYCLTWVQLLGSLPQASHSQLLEDRNWVRIERLLLFFSSSHKFSIGLKSKICWTLWYLHVIFKAFWRSVFGETKSVSIKSAPRKDSWWTSNRVIGGPAMHMGTDDLPGCSDPMDQLLELKLTMKLMLVLMERWKHNASQTS